MKTMLGLDGQLLANAKALAAQQRINLARVVEEGLRLRMRAKTIDDPARRPTHLPIFKGRGGLVAGVDARKNRALPKALEDDV